jgi:hypothetical protein
MADTTVDTTVDPNLNIRVQESGPVWTDASTGYIIYEDDAFDVVYQKTANGGATWGSPVTVHTGTVARLSIWFDKWTTGDAGTKIHIAYVDGGSEDVFYRDLDTSGDTLGTARTVFAGVSFVFGGWTSGTVSITKSRGGYLYVGFWGDAGGENGFFRSTDAGVNWTSRAALADDDSVDAILLRPSNEADDQDIWCIYWDRSADEISLKTYDDSGNSWSETSVETSMADAVNYHTMAASIRQSDGHLILAAWSELDATTADLMVWDINGSGSITAKTDVVTNLAESSQVSVFINQQNDDIYIAYLKGGTWESTVDVMYKKSTDGGASWGAEQAYSEAAADDLRLVTSGLGVGDDGGIFQPVWFNDDLDDLFVNLVNDVVISAAGVTTRRYSLPITGIG